MPSRVCAIEFCVVSRVGRTPGPPSDDILTAGNFWKPGEEKRANFELFQTCLERIETYRNL
jgi:hypothetical protein